MLPILHYTLEILDTTNWMCSLFFTIHWKYWTPPTGCAPYSSLYIRNIGHHQLDVLPILHYTLEILDTTNWMCSLFFTIHWKYWTPPTGCAPYSSLYIANTDHPQLDVLPILHYTLQILDTPNYSQACSQHTKLGSVSELSSQSKLCLDQMSAHYALAVDVTNL